MRSIFQRSGGSRTGDSAAQQSLGSGSSRRSKRDKNNTNNNGNTTNAAQLKAPPNSSSSSSSNNEDDLLLLQEKQQQADQPTIATLPPPPTHRRTNSSIVKKHASASLNHFMATTPITKHYQLNQQILSAFDSHYEAKLYQVAFAMGLTFCETALIEIPKHGYYNSKRHERERMQSSLEAVRVSNLLGDIQAQGDVYQVPHSSAERQRVQTLQTLAMESVERASEDQQFEAQRAAAEREFHQATTTVQDNGSGMSSQQQQQQLATRKNSKKQPPSQQEWVLLEPLLSCQDSISNVLCPAPGKNEASSPAVVAARVTGEVYSEQEASASALPVAVATPVPEPQPQSAGKKQRDSLISNDSSGEAAVANQDWIHVATSSSTQQSQSAEDLLLEKALYLSGLEILPQSSVLPEVTAEVAAQVMGDNKTSSSVTESDLEVDDEDLVAMALPETRLVPGKSRLQLATLARLYHEDFDALVHDMGRIQIQLINTFQGRLPGSTNGCTVIAPLLCIHHLLLDNDEGDNNNSASKSSKSSTKDDQGGGLDAMDVEHVIDHETPAILSEVRTQLGLSDQAFLIPADVHDYLIQNGQLHTSQFMNVVGGNILNEEHLSNFLSCLSMNNDGNKDKLAATLFFHEHVVAILKVPQRRRHHHHRPNGRHSSQRNDESSCWYHVIDSLPLKETLKTVDESNLEFAIRHGYTTNDKMDCSSDSDDLDSCLDCTAVFKCRDEEALKACLRWYACSKFTQDNVSYIDSYEWNDQQSDFDPRVFQAYVWGTAPTL